VELEPLKQRKLFTSGAEKLGLELNDKAVDDLLIYLSELIRWGKKMNLVGRTMIVEQIIENHFLDSLTLLSLLDTEPVHLLDVGSGAGFPGLVCKTVNKDMGLTIVEPRLKRVSFMRHIVRTLKLATVDIIAGRIEDNEDQDLMAAKMMFSHITGRAVTELSDFLRLVAEFVHPGVQVICMKGPKWQQELDRAEDIIREKSLTLTQKVHLLLPFSQAERTLLVFKR